MKSLGATFDPVLVADLKGVLGSLPGQTPRRIEQGMAELLAIADAYRASFPLTDTSGRRSRPSLAESRQAIKKLAKHLEDARDVFELMPIMAKATLASAAEAPLGPLAQILLKYSEAAKMAHVMLLAKPNKATDAARAALAVQVAVVFRDVLGVRPTATRIAVVNVTGKRGGAGYARALSTTLALAGWPNVDLGPLIDGGLKDLKDPTLSHNVP